MKRLVQRCFWSCVHLLLILRYRVRLEGAEQLRQLSGPILVLPNHPAYIDPPLVLSHLRTRQLLRPLVFAGTYRNPVLYPLMRAVDALEVPDLQAHSQNAKRQTREMIDRVVDAIHRGDSFLIYPSGRLQRQGTEVVGAARAVAEILSRCPQVQVALVRTRGVWGSVFSCAPTGGLPHLGRAAWRGFTCLLGNALFFAPRRQVSMQVQLLDRGDLPSTLRAELNAFLEEWYNRPGPEEPRFVPYFRWFGSRTFAYPEAMTVGDYDWERIPETLRRAVNDLVEEHLRRPMREDELRPESTLDRIGLDSLDRMDIALTIEHRYGFRSDLVANTLGELWALAAGLAAPAGGQPLKVPEGWNKWDGGRDQATVLAETIYSAFVERALRNPRQLVAADQISGGVTYRRLLWGSRVLAGPFSSLPGEAVGVLLPASVAADAVLMGLLAAGKLPVLLNWTTGPRNLAHAARTLQIQRVVTSRRFLDRLGLDVEGVEYAFLEDVRSSAGRVRAAWEWLRVRYRPGSTRRRVPVRDEDEPAVVLFTSGSESLPKAVPLTHRNILSNVRAGVAAMEIQRSDVLLGFLPPFHSFGLTANCVMPLVTGIRVAHHPDPTDAHGLVRVLAAYRPTLLFTTPTFLSYLCNAATAAEFQSLRLVVTGAEKCTQEVRDQVQKLASQALVAEGYGITECSPVVSVNRPGRIRWGTIGQPLEGVEVSVVHPETRQPLPAGQTGLLLIRGPTVFPGYLHYEGPSPFVEFQGQSWYNTGDLVAIDEHQFLHFRGRLKRFLKTAGEMVSLPALEEPLARAFPPDAEGPQVAVEGIETTQGRLLVLFARPDLSLRQANGILEQAGFRGIMRFDHICRLPSIPVLGTGKTDYRLLREQVKQLSGSVGTHVYASDDERPG